MASSSGAGVAGAALPGVVARLRCGGRETPSRSPAGRAARARRARPALGAIPVPRPRSTRSSSRRAAHARSATCGRVPGAQVLALAPGRGPQRSGLGAVAPGGLAERDRLEAVLGRDREHLGEPRRPLPPPVPEQLGVDRKHEQPAASRLGREPLQPRGRRGARTRAACSRGARRRRLGVVGVAADRPRAGAAQRLAVEVGVDRVGGVAVERPDPARPPPNRS